MFGQPTTPFGAPAAAPAASPFGAPAPAPGGFGAAATPAPFGAPAPAPAAGGFGGFGGAAAPAPAGGFGGFGAPAPAPAAGGFGGFGSPAPGAGATSAFGSPAPAATPFGSPAPAPGGFGATAGGFGAAPAPAAGGLFGGGAAATGGFGAAAAPAAGGFGAAATPGAGGFGAAPSTGFGASAPAPAFGAPAPAPSGGLFGGAPAPTFGATGATAPAFGSPAPAPGGLFGAAPAPAAGGIFGAGAVASTGKPGTLAVPYQITNKTDGTGSTQINIQAITAMPQYEQKSLEELRLEDYMAGNKGSMGQPGAAPAQGGFGGFGSPAPAPGGFGSPAPAPGAFGAPAPAPGGLFGGAPAPGAFGAPAPAPGAFGAAPKPLFGAPAPAPGGFSFGASPAPAPAAGGFGGFGAAAPKPAGGGLFGGAPAPAPGGLFGAPAPAPGGLFGGAPAPAPGGLFGSTPAPAPATGGLFGSAPAPAPAGGGLFGAPAPAPAGGGLFGAPAPAPAGGLFGAPAPAPAAGGLFGSPAPAPAAGGLFGAPAPKPAGGGLFGAPAPAPAGGGLFGSPAPAPAAGGLFGAPAPAAGGLFGSPAPAPAVGGLFGAPAPAPGGGLFGAPAPGAMPGAVAPYAVPAGVPPPTPDAVLAQQLAAIDREKQELENMKVWRGTSPSGSSIIPASLSEKEALARSAAYGYGSGAKANGGGALAATALSVYQPSTTPRSGAKIRPRGFGLARTAPLVAGAELIGTGKAGSSPLLSPDTYLGSSAKRLIIKEGSLAPKPKMRLQLTNGVSSAAKPVENGDTSPESSKPVDESAAAADEGVIHRAALDAAPGPTSPAASAAPQIAVATPPTPAFASPQTSGKSPAAAAAVDPRPAVPAAADDAVTPAPTEKATRTPRSSGKKGTPGGPGYDFYRRVVGAAGEPEENGTPQMNGGTGSPAAAGAHLPKLTKPGYDISPSLGTLSSMSESDLAAVGGFSVARAGIGSVAWDGAVDVRGVDLDSAVTIEEKDVAVYDAEEAKGTKPPVGSKLNRPAVITMYGVYPKEGKEANNEARQKFKRKIEKTTKKMGAELISFDVLTGVWKFRVKHFSRYGLFDDEDTEDEEEPLHAEEQSATAPDGMDAEMEQDFDAGDRGGRSPMREGSPGKAATGKVGGRSRIRAPSNEDDMSEKTEDDSVDLTSEGEVTGGEKEAEMLQAADTAYAMMFDTTRAAAAMDETEDEFDNTAVYEEDEDAVFCEDGEPSSDYVIEEPKPLDDVRKVKKSNFSARLAQKCGVQTATSSNTDFGMRMGRSFRVAWRPDGSFLVPGQVQLSSKNGPPAIGVNLVQRRPIFNERDSRSTLDEEVTKSLLETHLKHSVESQGTNDDCPSFELPKRTEGDDDDNESYKSLCSALDDFAEAASVRNAGGADPEVENVVSRAFSLLSTLLGQEDTDYDVIDQGRVPFPDFNLADERRKEALLAWLRKAVSQDVHTGIHQALRRSDVPAALLVAMSGCDETGIYNLAVEHGYTRLASLVSCGGEDCRSEARRQIEALHKSGATHCIPANMLRVYSLLGGDEGIEENLYKSGRPSPTQLDWRRRFALKLWCGDKVDKLSSLSQLYQSDCARGVSPLPEPRYASSSSGDFAKNTPCILYSLLSLGSRQQEQGNMSSIVTPLSHTSSPHDFSYAFHLASALSSMDVSTELTCNEMAHLVDGYVMQLMHSGYWEWAVYVCLCAGARSKSSRELWRLRANDIVTRSCTGELVSERSFLETEVGLPSAWFDSALAMRCAYTKDFVGQANYTSQIAPEISMEIFEELMTPDVLFRGKARELMERIEAMRKDVSGWQLLNENGVLYRFLCICREVLNFSQLSQSARLQHSDKMGELIMYLRDLKTRLEGDDILNYDGENISSRLNETMNIPRSACDAELLSCICLLEMQLLAMIQGGSIFQEHGALEGRRLKVASQLAFLSSSSEGVYSADALGASDVLRGDHAVE